MTVLEVKATLLGKQFLEVLPSSGNVSYSTYFDLLLNRVLPDLRQISRRFPEYTPHDDVHIKNLFGVTEKLLGKALIKSLTPTEAFCLACGLVAHDWGMAVSDAEIEKIAAGESGHVSLADPAARDKDFRQYLLPDEADRFARFCSVEGTSRDDFATKNHARLQADYVRLTHAFRSSARIAGFFDDEPKLAETIGAICVGHAIDIKRLEDETAYPPLRSLREDKVNVQALSLYLRLIDLFDICQNRTPVELHRFVSPKDEYSKQEWVKHFSLHEFAVDGEALKFEGKVTSIKVWTSLLNLKQYCNDQFDRTRNLLIQRNQGEERKHYQLPVKWLDWTNLHSDGFEAETVRFEFDRTNVFRMLSLSIYDDDPLVFIRELLQNAIDATRTREELLAKIGLSFGKDQDIRISVLDKEGEHVIAVTDPGTGMDRYVIAHYLSVAGRSYYRSRDFERLNLPFDPISRFGIGILSCFAVASWPDPEKVDS